MYSAALPYKRYTKLMLILLTGQIVYWLDSFPSETGISLKVSHATIVEECLRPDLSQNHIAFGAYVMCWNLEP